MSEPQETQLPTTFDSDRLPNLDRQRLETFIKSRLEETEQEQDPEFIKRVVRFARMIEVKLEEPLTHQAISELYDLLRELKLKKEKTDTSEDEEDVSDEQRNLQIEQQVSFWNQIEQHFVEWVRSIDNTFFLVDKKITQIFVSFLEYEEAVIGLGSFARALFRTTFKRIAKGDNSESETEVNLEPLLKVLVVAGATTWLAVLVFLSYKTLTLGEPQGLILPQESLIQSTATLDNSPTPTETPIVEQILAASPTVEASNSNAEADAVRADKNHPKWIGIDLLGWNESLLSTNTDVQLLYFLSRYYEPGQPVVDAISQAIAAEVAEYSDGSGANRVVDWVWIILLEYHLDYLDFFEQVDALLQGIPDTNSQTRDGIRRNLQDKFSLDNPEMEAYLAQLAQNNNATATAQAQPTQTFTPSPTAMPSETPTPLPTNTPTIELPQPTPTETIQERQPAFINEYGQVLVDSRQLFPESGQTEVLTFLDFKPITFYGDGTSTFRNVMAILGNPYVTEVMRMQRENTSSPFGVNDFNYDKSWFGGRDPGVDLLSENDEVYAPFPLKIVYVGQTFSPDGGLGDQAITAVATDKDGKPVPIGVNENGEDVYFLISFGHLEEASVVKGQFIQTGVQIGEQGSRGLSSAKHLDLTTYFGPLSIDTAWNNFDLKRGVLTNAGGWLRIDQKLATVFSNSPLWNKFRERASWFSSQLVARQ